MTQDSVSFVIATIPLSPPGDMDDRNPVASPNPRYSDDSIEHHFSCEYTAQDVARGKPEQQIVLARTAGYLFEQGRIAHKGRSPVQADISITASYDSSQTLIGFAKVACDIREVKPPGPPCIIWETWIKPDRKMKRVDFVSDNVHSMIGYSVEEWLSTPNFWLSIVHPADRKRAMYEAAENFTAHKKGTQKFRWVRKDRKVLWVESSYFVITDDTGQPVGLRGVTIDITERRQKEVKKPETLESLRPYFDLGLIGMTITSEDGSILEVNDETCKILGYPRSELLQKTWIELTHPEDAEADAVHFERAIAGECEGYVVDKRFIHRDERVIYSTISVKCVRHANGSFAYMVGLIQDITGRRLAEEALRDSETRYHQLFESSPDPIFVFDQATLRFLAFNEAAVHEYGYSREELFLRTSMEIWPPMKFAAFPERLSQSPQDSPRETIWKHHRKDGTALDVEIMCYPAVFAGRTAWVMLAHNVTKRRLLEEQLRQSQKMEAIGQLAGGMAHDFNNLLTVINGYSDIAMDETPASSPLRKNVEEIRRAGDRATGLIRQLLAFSRKQVLMPAILDLNKVISGLEKMLPRLLREDIALHIHRADTLGRVKADRGQMEQILMNLVINARDAMAPGGELTIETHNVDLPDVDVPLLPRLNPGPYVMLSITDTGHGMDAETLDHIFEPFFTTKEIGTGTGLGLSTVYGIVGQSGGDIRVNSEVGRGTSFQIYLPRVDDVPSPDPQSVELREKLRGTETVLLTEDDDIVRAFASRVLSTYGYRVLEASNGTDAIAICEQLNYPIHLLITDVVMPGMNGRDLMNRLEAIYPELVVLFMSGYTERTVEHQKIMDENLPYIQKPFTIQSFVSKIREVLDPSI